MSSSDITTASTASPLARHTRALALELLQRERRLALFGAALMALLLPLVLMLLFDDRSLRGANVWLKPIKFALSIALFTWTTAWLIGHLPASRRSSRAVDMIVWMLIGAGSFEWTYITLQAALGQASHYNVADAWHATMYSLIGVGAVAMTSTQVLLAWQLFRHSDPRRPAAFRAAVLIGLLLTFVLGTAVGGLLSGIQPPTAAAPLPLFGWSLAGGDLRPAHFVAIHAQQLMPLAGYAAITVWPRRARSIVAASTIALCCTMLVLVASGLAGQS
ncbi:hypothetical protein [Piscinibacter sakaiensis]|uniref:hypothetical protein n=1 Tax=Piscinibacter sakaiensis TaxID=1547922 RepID=UPI003AAF36D4